MCTMEIASPIYFHYVFTVVSLNIPLEWNWPLVTTAGKTVKLNFTQSQHTCGCPVTVRRCARLWQADVKLNAAHQRAHRVPDSLFLPRDVRELNGRLKRRLRHFYFCTDITSERGTDVTLSCCSERQNKARTGNRQQHPRPSAEAVLKASV